MSDGISDLSRQLARNAEAVCREYLPAGRRQGRYWIVGDVRNTPGRSMFVRLNGPDSGRGAAGRWTDAASAEHGDLLDVIREARGHARFGDTLREARAFLRLPHPAPMSTGRQVREPAATGSPEASRRLLAISQPIIGTIAATYLSGRAIVDLRGTGALRFHPRCYYLPEHGPTDTWPAMIAAVTDLAGTITGAHRTWLTPDGSGKAPVDTPRRAMGELLGHAVRFGLTDDVMAAGEGIETMLSLRQVMPDMPLAAGLSSAHLAAMLLPPTLRRLYIARDDDAAGDAASDSLAAHARSSGIEPIVLSPALDDFNDDLVLLGLEDLRASLRIQLAPEDVGRFLAAPG